MSNLSDYFGVGGSVSFWEETLRNATYWGFRNAIDSGAFDGGYNDPLNNANAITMSNMTQAAGAVTSEGGGTGGAVSNIVPKMTSDTAPSGNVFASSGTSPWLVFDRTASSWQPLVGGACYVGYAWAAVRTCVKYSIKRINSGYLSNTWTCQGTNDTVTDATSANAATWTDLDQVTDDLAPLTRQEYTIDSPAEYKAYRLRFTDPTDGGVYLEEVEFLAELDSIVPYMTSNTAPSGLCGAGTESSPAWHAFDDSLTTYYKPSAAGDITLGYKATAAAAISGYTLRRDSFGDLTYNWTVQGSNNTTTILDGSWTTIDTRVGVDLVANTKTQFNLASTETYQAYRIVITLPTHGGLQLVGMEFLAAAGSGYSPASLTTDTQILAEAPTQFVMTGSVKDTGAGSAVVVGTNVIFEVDSGSGWFEMTMNNVGEEVSGSDVYRYESDEESGFGTDIDMRIRTTETSGGAADAPSISVHDISFLEYTL